MGRDIDSLLREVSNSLILLECKMRQENTQQSKRDIPVINTMLGSLRQIEKRRLQHKKSVRRENLQTTHQQQLEQLQHRYQDWIGVITQNAS